MAKKKAAKKAPSANTGLVRVEKLVRQGFQQVDRRFERVDRRFEQIDRHFEQIDRHFEQIDRHFEQIDRHFEQIDRRFDQVDQRFEQVDRRLDLVEVGQRDLRSEMGDKLALIDDRINLLANHVDGFMKLHETLDIEFKVMKEQMSRLEARLNRLEAERTT